MAIDNSFPEWMLPRMTPWQNLALGAQVGAQIAQARYRNQALKVQVEQQAQQDVLQMRQLALREQQMTVVNQAKLNDMEEAAAVAHDAPILANYLKTGELVGDLKSPKSYAHISQIDLSRSRSELGKQIGADITEFNRRLKLVTAEDRASIVELQRNGAPAADIWSALGGAERKEQARVAEEKRKMTEAQALAAADRARGLDIREAGQADTAANRAAQLDLQLERLGIARDRLALDTERMKQGKAFAPSEIKKMHDEADEADKQGKHELAGLLRTRAVFFATQQKQSKTMQAFKLDLLPRLRADPANKKKTNEQLNEIAESLYRLATTAPEEPTEPTSPAAPSTRPVFRFLPDNKSLEPVAP